MCSHRNTPPHPACSASRESAMTVLESVNGGILTAYFMGRPYDACSARSGPFGPGLGDGEHHGHTAARPSARSESLRAHGRTACSAGGGSPIGIGELAESGEPFPEGSRQPGAEVLLPLMLHPQHDPLRAPDRRPAGGGEADDPGPPVPGVGNPLDEALLLQADDEHAALGFWRPRGGSIGGRSPRRSCRLRPSSPPPSDDAPVATYDGATSRSIPNSPTIPGSAGRNSSSSSAHTPPACRVAARASARKVLRRGVWRVASFRLSKRRAGPVGSSASRPITQGNQMSERVSKRT